MGSWIKAAKEQIKSIVTSAQDKFKMPLRTAFVGYRDFVSRGTAARRSNHARAARIERPSAELS